ncbi:MAG: hypothetical protein HKN04_05145, partial [Rhodothermaceae bacterium]|nr:hypothetical protein [Rhodothermaceae bacterium]
ARLSQALVLGLDAGRPDEALSLIGRMRRDDKNFQNRAEVELAYARILAAADRPDEARERFEALLYDEDFRRAAVPRAETYLHYGSFYRDVRGDYIRAAAYFDTAATNLRTEPGREELVTRAALTGVRRQADVFRSYADIAGRLAEADSLLYLGSLNEEDFRAAIRVIEAERQAAWLEEQRRLNTRRAESGFGGTTGFIGETLPGDRRDDTPTTEGTVSGIEVGFLNYRNLTRVQDALVAFQQVWGDRPLVPNWRRRSSITGAVLAGTDETGQPIELQSGTGVGGPPPLDLSNVPRTEATQIALRLQRADLRYELGNVLFLSLAEPDSAAAWYRLVVEEDVDAPVAVRSRYALAEVRREQGRLSEAEPLYQRVLDDAAGTPLADQARERLGLPPVEPENQTDSLALAQEAYESAYARWQVGAYRQAFESMLSVAERYATSEVAARALLASAAVFTDWVQRDTLDLVLDFPADLVPPDLVAAIDELPAEARTLSVPSDGEEREGETERSDEAAVDDELLDEDALLEQRRRASQDERLPDVLEDEIVGEGDRRDERSEDEIDPRSVDRPRAPAGGPPQVSPDAPSQEVEPVADSTVADLDIAGQTDAVMLPADSLVADSVVADSLVADSAVVDSTGSFVGADSTGVPSVGLADLYALVENRFPQTPYAERAQRLRAALLASLAPEVPADQEPDEEPLEELAEPVVAAVPSEAFPDAAAPDAALPPELVAQMPPGTFGMGGDRPLSTSIGAYTWRVATVPNALAARALLGNFTRRELRAAAFAEETPQGTQYVLIIGLYPSVAEAEAVRGQLPRSGTNDPYVIELTNRVLLSEGQLLERGGSSGSSVE